jgi:hypothetical protein
MFFHSDCILSNACATTIKRRDQMTIKHMANQPNHQSIGLSNS